MKSDNFSIVDKHFKTRGYSLFSRIKSAHDFKVTYTIIQNITINKKKQNKWEI